MAEPVEPHADPETEQKVRSFLKGRFRGYRDDLLLEDRLDQIVDSLGLFELVEFLEQSFSFRIPNEEFHPTRFATIGKILEVVRQFSPHSKS